ncbi:desmethyl-deoxy-podophyllotoxin synthase-like [Populus nigra]|uniref:desmethyl-deoxy-podophyllotoxin synthase-like n=1 Tax=Populus nigra TaxID=3691 RepID=UPI002B26E21C|nr:desmethyl-deoxy-podophyllotoxin synthase-like [Populus nigra]
MEQLQIPTSLVLLSSLLFIFMVLRILKKSKTKAFTPNLPPGPRKLPVIGNLHQLFCSLPHHRLRDLAEKHGPIMHLQLGQVQTIVISSPETAEQVMKVHDINFAHRPHLLAAEIIFYNCTDIATAAYGDYWRQLRKISILELLSPKRVQSFRSIREEEVSSLIGSISSSAGSIVNLSRMLFSVAYNITTRAAFSKLRKEEEIFVPLVQGIIQVGAGFNIGDLFPSIKLLPWITGMRSRMERLHQEADRILESIIKEHRARKAEGNSSNESKADDLVDVLLDLQEHGKLDFSLTTDNIKAVILDLFIAGTETSSTILEWAMSELLKHPEVMEKAQTEVREVLGKDGGVGELNYLKMVIRETMRLHPPLPLLLPRECREECGINGYNIPIKSRVLVNVWAIGRDTNYWVEAERFHPERFLDSAIDYKGVNFEFTPFGAGRRMCPGILFGISNVDLLLANLLYHFDWKLPGDMKPESLDMSEAFGATVRRKNALHLTPILHHPHPVRS